MGLFAAVDPIIRSDKTGQFQFRLFLVEEEEENVRVRVCLWEDTNPNLRIFFNSRPSAEMQGYFGNIIFKLKHCSLPLILSDPFGKLQNLDITVVLERTLFLKRAHELI